VKCHGPGSGSDSDSVVRLHGRASRATCHDFDSYEAKSSVLTMTPISVFFCPWTGPQPFSMTLNHISICYSVPIPTNPQIFDGIPPGHCLEYPAFMTHKGTVVYNDLCRLSATNHAAFPVLQSTLAHTAAVYRLNPFFHVSLFSWLTKLAPSGPVGGERNCRYGKLCHWCDRRVSLLTSGLYTMNSASGHRILSESVRVPPSIAPRSS
jgi:hypothetical protein